MHLLLYSASVILDVPEVDEFVLSNVWWARLLRLENGDIMFSNFSWNHDIAFDGSINLGLRRQRDDTRGDA